jgi:hypothetical protein
MTFEYHKLKESLLFNPLWIIQTGTYAIATAERAVCDRLYLSPWYYFDNLEPLQPDLLFQIAELYPSRVILSLKKMLNAQ